MANLRKLLLIVAVFCLSFSMFSQNIDKDFDVDKQAIELIVNGEKIIVQSLPQNGLVEVFNILGTKITVFQLAGGASATRLNLPKGYYILKSDNITKKIVVK